MLKIVGKFWKMLEMLENVRADGPCPRDVDGIFTLTEGPMEGQEKDCQREHVGSVRNRIHLRKEAIPTQWRRLQERAHF